MSVTQWAMGNGHGARMEKTRGRSATAVGKRCYWWKACMKCGDLGTGTVKTRSTSKDSGMESVNWHPGARALNRHPGARACSALRSRAGLSRAQLLFLVQYTSF